MPQVIITPKAKKQYDHLPSNDKNKIKKKLTSLVNEPLAGKKLTGELSELRSLRAWPYRIIYYVENDNVFVTSIIHRQGAY
jgi:mRNA-degrading endonuclease RelE of RelBE toxin-antitoxin system